MPAFAPALIPDAAAVILAPAFKRGLGYSVTQWLQRCRDDLAQLWTGGGYWLISEVQDHAGGRVLHLVASAGTYNLALIREVEAWGRANGCTKVIFSGRPGWRKRAENDGFKLASIMMTKEL